MKTAVIHPCKPEDKDDRPADQQKVCLYTSDGSKLLGRHPSKEKAEAQERAIQVNKHASLRSQTIRLAHEKPELREHLLPLLKVAFSKKDAFEYAYKLLKKQNPSYQTPVLKNALEQIFPKQEEFESYAELQSMVKNLAEELRIGKASLDRKFAIEYIYQDKRHSSSFDRKTLQKMIGEALPSGATVTWGEALKLIRDYTTFKGSAT